MKLWAIGFCVYLLWMACLPCTDSLVEHDGMHPDLHDVAHSTGESPFHENTCPTFCVCGCCAMFTIAVEAEHLVFPVPLPAPQSKPLFFIVSQAKHLTFPIWRPPQHLA